MSGRARVAGFPAYHSAIPRPSTDPLLAYGNEEAWAQVNAEHARQRHESARAATVEERVERGVALSRLAHDIRVAVRDARSDGRRA